MGLLMRRALRLLVVAVVATAATSGLVGTAASARVAACSADQGVTVVVDFGSLGGGVQQRCVLDAVSSGFDALRRAGFSVTSTQRFPGLLCRIDGLPADDPCISTPSAARYWSYWTAAAPGGPWTYSTEGAASRIPPPGSVEGWSFSEGCEGPPGAGGCSTGSSTTTTASPPATTPTTAAASGAAGPTSPTADPAQPGTDLAISPADPPATSSSTITTPDPLAGTDSRPSREELASPSAGSAASGPSSGAGAGSPVGVLVVLGAVAALGGAAALRARRGRAPVEATP